MLKYTLLPFLFFICGCAGVAAVAGVYAAGEIVSVATTSRTIDDHIVSSVKEQDCSVARWIEGKKYCIDKESLRENKTEKTYCYKTLAGVDCYSEPLKNQNDYLINP